MALMVLSEGSCRPASTRVMNTRVKRALSARSCWLIPLAFLSRRMRAPICFGVGLMVYGRIPPGQPRVRSRVCASQASAPLARDDRSVSAWARAAQAAWFRPRLWVYLLVWGRRLHGTQINGDRRSCADPAQPLTAVARFRPSVIHRSIRSSHRTLFLTATVFTAASFAGASLTMTAFAGRAPPVV